jgi:starch synthase
MHIVHLAAECAPIAKVGGLADVVGALPAALSAEGTASSILMPLYGGPHGSTAARAGALARVGSGEVWFGPDAYAYTVYRSDALGAPLYLLDQPEHFGPEGVYFRTEDGLPFDNDDTRFPLFQLCALHWLAGGDAPAPDVLHLHDHHTGLIPALLRHGSGYEALRDVPTMFTVHSADHQGVLPWGVWERLGVFVEEAETLLVGDEVNSMKAALNWSDAVTTVSPSYAEELATNDSMAGPLAEVFRAIRHKTTGILNGVDYGAWNPATDSYLDATYSADDLAGKADCKAAVCAELGLDAARPLVAFIGRLMPEKGVEILLEGVERVLRKTGATVALLGTGYPEHEHELRGLVSMMAHEGLGDRVAARIAFDNTFAHRLYAAADIFLMPSKSEPCGLGQLYAMAYGTPPVVHAVGGLRDTVVPWDGEAGTGFTFDAFTPGAIRQAVQQALDVHADSAAWGSLVRQAMAADWSWARSARAYTRIYQRLASVPA